MVLARGVPLLLIGALFSLPALGQVKFVGTAGDTRMSLEKAAKGWRFLDDKGALVLTLQAKGDQLKAADPAGKDVVRIARKEDGAQVEDGAGKALYRLRRNESREWTISAGKGAEGGSGPFLKVRPAAGGFELTDAGGKVIVASKAAQGNVTLQDSGGKAGPTLQGTTNARAAAWLPTDLIPLPVRASLLLYFLEIEK